MYVLFRSTPRRLMASLRESRRVDGKVRAEHLASLGAVPLPMTVVGRIAFWTALHERLGRLANRVGEEHGKILGAVHARIPMVTADECDAERKNHIEAEVAAWGRIEATYARIITSDEKRIAKCHEQIEVHRGNIRDAFLPLKDSMAAAAIQHRGALETGNAAAGRAFVEERGRSIKELGSILGNRLTADKRSIEALLAKAKAKAAP